MPIFQNALAMGSRLHLSLSPASSPSMTSHPDSSSSVNRKKGDWSKTKSGQSGSGSKFGGSPTLTVPSGSGSGSRSGPGGAKSPMFGSSRQRERRVQGSPSSLSSPSTATSTPTMSAPPSPYFPSHLSHQSYTSTSSSSSSSTPTGFNGTPRSPATPLSAVHERNPSAAVAPTVKKSMFNLKNLSTNNLVRGRKTAGPSKQSVGRIGLGVQGLFEEAEDDASRFAERIVKMDQVAPFIAPRDQSLSARPSSSARPTFGYPSSPSHSLDASNESSAEDTDEEEDFVSYRNSYIHDFPLPPAAAAQKSTTLQPTNAVTFQPASPRVRSVSRYQVAVLPNSLQELLALRAETTQIYNAAVTPPAPTQSPRFNLERKATRKAVPTMMPTTVVEEGTSSPTPSTTDKRSFYANARATQSVMVFSSSSSNKTAFNPLPLPISIPSRKESLTPTITPTVLSQRTFVPPIGISRPHTPAPIDTLSRRNSFNSATSSSIMDGDTTPGLTSCSGTSTKSFSSSSQSSGSYRGGSDVENNSATSSPRAPDFAYLRKPVFELEVAIVSNNHQEDEGERKTFGGGARPSFTVPVPVTPKTLMMEGKKKQGFWSKARKALKA